MFETLLKSARHHYFPIFTQTSKRSCFSTPFGNQRVNGFEKPLKSTRYHYLPIFKWIRDKLSWKNSAFVTSEISRLFVNTLTPDDKYSRRYMQIFWQQIQTPLSQKWKSFCRLLVAFLKCSLNLEHSWKKEEYPSLIITEIIASERDVYLSA